MPSIVDVVPVVSPKVSSVLPRNVESLASIELEIPPVSTLIVTSSPLLLVVSPVPPRIFNVSVARATKLFVASSD